MTLKLPHLDQQVASVEHLLIGLEVPARFSTALPSHVYDEVLLLDEQTHHELRQGLGVSPEEYLEEMAAFQVWMDFANAAKQSPVIVRAQVITQLYVAFVWLRDSLMYPVSEKVAEGATKLIFNFFKADERNHFRNSVAHGRWTYLKDFTGLQYWDGPKDKPLTRFTIDGPELEAWQVLSRATTTAVLLALAHKQ
jgi:hypothetical protein